MTQSTLAQTIRKLFGINVTDEENGKPERPRQLYLPFVAVLIAAALLIALALGVGKEDAEADPAAQDAVELVEEAAPTDLVSHGDTGDVVAPVEADVVRPAKDDTTAPRDADGKGGAALLSPPDRAGSPVSL